MITSYKESNTEEEFNEKLIKDDHPKDTTYMFIGVNNPPIMFVTLMIKLVFKKYVFEAAHWSGLYGKILHG